MDFFTILYYILNNNMITEYSVFISFVFLTIKNVTDIPYNGNFEQYPILKTEHVLGYHNINPVYIGVNSSWLPNKYNSVINH